MIAVARVCPSMITSWLSARLRQMISGSAGAGCESAIRSARARTRLTFSTLRVIFARSGSRTSPAKSRHSIGMPDSFRS